MNSLGRMIQEISDAPVPGARLGAVTAIAAGPPRTITATVAGASLAGIRVMDHVAPIVGGGVWILDTGAGSWIAFGTNSSVQVGPTTVPAGVVQDYVGASAPPGWAALNGSTLIGAQTLYPSLWAVAPTAWRSGANLVLADATGRVSVGLASAGTFITIGGVGGAETVTLTAAQSGLPAHAHDLAHNHASFTITGGAHQHAMRGSATDTSAAGGFGEGNIADDSLTSFTTLRNTSSASHSHTIDVPALAVGAANSGTVTAASATASHTNLQPYIVLNKIIKVH